MTKAHMLRKLPPDLVSKFFTRHCMSLAVCLPVQLSVTPLAYATCSGVARGGARGARAPPLFMGSLQKNSFVWYLSNSPCKLSRSSSLQSERMTQRSQFKKTGSMYIASSSNKSGRGWDWHATCTEFYIELQLLTAISCSGTLWNVASLCTNT